MSGMPILLRQPQLGAQRRVIAAPDAMAVANPVAEQQDAPSAVDIASIRAHAEEAGYAAGLARGLADAVVRIDEETARRVAELEATAHQQAQQHADEHRQRVAALDAALRAVQAALAGRLELQERLAVELAYEALCRIAGAQAHRAGLLADAVQQGFDRLRGPAALGLRMHPASLKELIAHPAGRALADAHPAVQWSADAALQPGDCRIDTDHGQLELGLAAQLDRLRALWLLPRSATAGPAPEAEAA